MDIMDTKKVRPYYLAIMLYELSIMLKYAFVLANLKTGLIFYYSTSACEMLFAIFFIFVSEDNARLAIPIKSRS